MKHANNLRLLAVTALFTAVIAVMSQISIPLPYGVPLTLQTFSVALCGYVLGKKYSVIAVAVYLTAGLIGAPVFANFTSGPAVFASNAGGFLYGFLIAAFFCGIGSSYEKLGYAVIFGVIGIVMCHVPGVIWFAYATGASIMRSFILASLPFLLKDIASAVIACFIGRKLRSALAAKVDFSF